MKPMLAFRYQDRQKHIKYPCFVQPKLNGVRLLYRSGTCQTRWEKYWNPGVLEHIQAMLEHIPSNIILDGELYLHGKSLQRINSAVAVSRLEPNSETKQIQYHVFDAVDTKNHKAPQEERFLMLNELLTLVPSPIVLVPTKLVTNIERGDYFYAMWKKQGYEGMMYRNKDAAYGFLQYCSNQENRWNDLIKRKDWLDGEFLIVDFKITRGEKGERGFNLICEADNGNTFSVGSGLTDAELDSYELAPPIAHLARIRYEMLSDAGIPLKPSVELIFS